VLDAACAKCQAQICRRVVVDGTSLMASRKRPPAVGVVLSRQFSKESAMSVYRVTEIIGTSGTSWEDAAAEAIRTAAGTIRDLRVAEVVKQDIHLDENGAITYRTKLQLSFKYEAEH
jgi:flavin-binding protein dodecin